MPDQRKLTVEDEIKNSDLSEDLKKAHIELCRFLEDNAFPIEPEDDGDGWKISFMNKCVGHMNFTHAGIWIDTCDFGGSAAADDVLKEAAWAHVRICEHFSSDGKQCGCGRQPGFDKMIFGKAYKNLCFAHLEFINPDVETVEHIKKLMILFTK